MLALAVFTARPGLFVEVNGSDLQHSFGSWQECDELDSGKWSCILPPGGGLHEGATYLVDVDAFGCWDAALAEDLPRTERATTERSGCIWGGDLDTNRVTGFD